MAKKYSLTRPLTGYAMASPGAILLFMFVIVPFVLAIIFSFTNQRLTSKAGDVQFVGFSNYQKLLGAKIITVPSLKDDSGQVVIENGKVQYEKVRSVLRSNDALLKRDPDMKRAKEVFIIPFSSNQNGQKVFVAKDAVFWKSIINTGLFVLMVVPLQCGTALILAMMVNRQMAGRNFFRTAFFMPVVTSMVVVSIVWNFMLRPDGPINNLIGTTGLDWLNTPSTAMFAIVVLSAWQGAGYQMLIFLAGLQGISADLYEAASIDGANGMQKFRNVTLPGLRNTIVFVILSTTMMAFALYVQIDVLTKGGPADATQTLVFHSVRIGSEQGNIGYASTISVIYFIIILCIAFIQRYILERKAD